MRVRFLSLLLLVSTPVFADDKPSQPPPPTCPQCGKWELNGGTGGVTGEWVLIKPERVDIPSLGSFCAHTTRKSIDIDPDERRRHLVVLNLGRGDECATPDSDSLRMELEVRTGSMTEGSYAHMAIYPSSQTKALFEASGWNTERENPCDSGLNAPFIDCYVMDYAGLYKRLSYEAFDISRGLAKREAALFNRRFSPAAFAAKVEEFCDKQGTLWGAGSGTTLVSYSCQVERLQAKLHELEAWQACIGERKRACAVPGLAFDRSDVR